ncbi:MAG: proline--tRNA ligase [Candidatus Omnitrophica bacterium]|nr:proline--tRNA ligase [Candidatus Omnitrophota bacterium]
MLWLNSFIPTIKEVPQEAETTAHKLMLRAGLVRMLISGVYSYLPLGLRVLNNIENIIRKEMNSVDANELLLPALQPLELWQRSGRDKDIGEVMLRFSDRKGRKLCLGPTHEEVITELVKTNISSYRQLPLILYQIQAKFRDEIRPRFGLIRSCEFIMKDAYSFDRDEEGLERNYQAIYEAYKRIFKRLGLEFLITEADPGVMGGNLSHEFMVPARDGEDIVLKCPRCNFAKTFQQPDSGLEAASRSAVKQMVSSCPTCSREMEKVNTIEVGHIFKLGTKYSCALGANFLDDKGKLRPIIMGCYGIGVSRLIPAIIEQNNDKDGIIWPKEIAPYKVIVLALDVTDNEIMRAALRIYKELENTGTEVLFDNRDERAGVKFKDADLLGIPLQVVIGMVSIKDSKVELKMRRENKKISVSLNEASAKIQRLING